MDINTQLFSLSSAEIDERIGFRIDEIEHQLHLKARDLRPGGTVDNLGHVLHGGHQTWVGLDPQTLNTPYAELVRACEILKPQSGELMVDLGAGYGRLGMVLHQLYPGVKFLGLELVPERVAEGRRIFEEWGYSLGRMEVADLTERSFMLPKAQYYFIYDFGKVQHIRETLKQLAELADSQIFTVIARGKGVRSIIDYEHPWLSDVFPVIKEENFSIYSMTDRGSRG